MGGQNILRKNYKYFFVSEKNSIFALAKRKVAQLVAHYVRDVGVGRSNRLFPTERLNSYRIKSFFVDFLKSEIDSSHKSGFGHRIAGYDFVTLC